MSGRRRASIWTLVVLASVLAFLGSLGLWVNRQILDNETFTKTSRDLIEDPAVRQSLSVYLVNQLYQNVDVAATLKEQLPPNLDPLAAPLAGALRDPATRGVAFLLERPRLQNLWVTAMGRTHQRLVNVLENKTGEGVSTGNGVVTLQLGALLQRLSDQLGLPGTVADRLPPEAGTIVVMKSSQLSAAQAAVEAIHVFSKWLLVLVIAMYALAAYLARGTRRITIRRIGWALVIVGLLLLVVRKVVGNYIVDAITSPTYHGTGHNVWAIATAVLGEIGQASVLYGLMFVAAMVFAGGSRYAVAARRAVAPVLIDSPAVAWSAAGGVLLLLVLWGGTHALRTWWGVLLVAVLFAAGLVALRRQVIEERDGPAPDHVSEYEAPKAVVVP
jgi:hypothetical protein